MKNYDVVIHDPVAAESFRRVDVVGCLDSHTVVGFEKTLHGLLDQGVNQLVLDLSQLGYISSAGISALMGLTHRLRRNNGELVLLKPSEKIFRVFRTLGFTHIFKIVEDEGVVPSIFSAT